MATLWKRKKKGGKFVYMIDFYYQGKRFQKSTRTDNPKTAKIILKDIEARIARGTFNVEVFQKKRRIYLNEFVDEFLEYSMSHKARSTWLRDRLVLKGFKQFCGNRALLLIDKRVIDQFIGERVKKLSRSTVNIDLRHIKAALTKAVEWGYLERNPAKGIKPLSVPQTAPKFFTEVQMKSIIGSIDYQPLKEIVIFAVNTGVRIGELINIKWSDVDFGNMTVRISQKDGFETKSRKERTIPLNEKAYDVLSGIERKGEYVFARRDGKKRDKHFISRRFKACLTKEGLSNGFSFHCLRHTFASHLVQKGVSLYIVSKLLGHANTKTTEIYAHLAPQTFHGVVKLLEEEKAPKSPEKNIVKS